MPVDKETLELSRLALEFERIGKAGAMAAQEESRRLGVPNVYVINGQLYYELPNGELSLEDPYVEPKKTVPIPTDGPDAATTPKSIAPQD